MTPCRSRTGEEGAPAHLLDAAEPPCARQPRCAVDHLAGAWRQGRNWTGTGDLTAVEALFANLDTQDADLIVAGAFAYSRLYEGLSLGCSISSISKPCRC
jgi:hypothetical protein